MNRLFVSLLCLVCVFVFANFAIADDAEYDAEGAKNAEAEDQKLIGDLILSLEQGGCLESADDGASDNKEYSKFYLRENQLDPETQEKNIAVICVSVPKLPESEENNLFRSLLCYDNTNDLKNLYSTQIKESLDTLKKLLSSGQCDAFVPCQKKLPSLDSSGSGCAFGKCHKGQFCIPIKKDLRDPRNPKRTITIIECGCVDQEKAECGETKGIKDSNFCSFGICPKGQYCTTRYKGPVQTCGCESQSGAPSCGNAKVPTCVGKCIDGTGKEDPSLQCSLINDKGKPRCACKPLCNNKLAPQCDGVCSKDPNTQYPTGEICHNGGDKQNGGDKGGKCSCLTPCNFLAPGPDGSGCKQGVGCRQDEICVRKDQTTCGCAKDCEVLTKACSGGSCYPESLSTVDDNKIFLSRKCSYAPQRTESSYDSNNNPVCGCYISNCGSLKTPEDCSRVVSGCLISDQTKESTGICQWDEKRKYCACRPSTLD